MGMRNSTPDYLSLLYRSSISKSAVILRMGAAFFYFFQQYRMYARACPKYLYIIIRFWRVQIIVHAREFFNRYNNTVRN